MNDTWRRLTEAILAGLHDVNRDYIRRLAVDRQHDIHFSGSTKRQRQENVYLIQTLERWLRSCVLDGRANSVDGQYDIRKRASIADSGAV